MKIRSSSLFYAKKKRNAKMKSQESRLENTLHPLKKDYMRTIYRKQKRIKHWTSWPLKHYKEKKFLFTKQKARLYDRKAVGTMRGKNTKYFLNLQKRHFNKRTVYNFYSCQIILSLREANLFTKNSILQLSHQRMIFMMTYSSRRLIHSYSMNWNNRNAEGL